MVRALFPGLVLTVFAAWEAGAQARVASAPAENYLLTVTQRWGAQSPLGDLRAGRMEAGDVELRLWSGYGMAGSYGVVLRRTGGRWSGWRVETSRCVLHIPVAVGDTLSDQGRRRYEDLARQQCGTVKPGALAVGAVITVDSIALAPLPPGTDFAAAWDAAVGAGLLNLPPKVQRPRWWIILHGTHYMVELRRGDEYRASVIEHVPEPETDADRKVQRVYQVVDQRLGIRPG
ncbi:MAG TPA: hypothetical protein VFS20_08925 [Longimicrobium sp.]|nr:hypothetical protein [Longimicrobium sp.]